MSFHALKRSIIYFFKQYRYFGIPDKSAVLAFRALFAFAPILILVISVGRFFVIDSGVEEHIALFLSTHFGSAAEGFLERTIAETASGAVNATVAFISFALVVYGASLFIFSLQSSFFSIFSVSLDERPVRRTAKLAALSIGYLALFIFFVTSFFLVRFFVGVGVSFVESLTLLDVGAFFVHATSELVFLVLTSTFFATTYKLFSQGLVSWKDAYIGSLFSAIALTILNNLLNLYFTFSDTIVLYGAASFFVALLLWLYYFSLIIFLGALLARMSSDTIHSASDTYENNSYSV